MHASLNSKDKFCLYLIAFLHLVALPSIFCNRLVYFKKTKKKTYVYIRSTKSRHYIRRSFIFILVQFVI